MATKSSTKSKSALKGTSAADVLTVKNDQVTVTGAGGNDTIKITKGNSSKVSGGAGADTITVSAGKSHTLHGNAANDTIIIGKSVGTSIKAYGDAGNDTMKTSNSYAVTFYGGDGNDTLTGGKGGDKLYGQAGADKLYGGAGKDTLSGGAGNDLLNGQAGNDTLTGGAGKDTFVYANGGGSDIVTDYAAGYDTLQISSGSVSKTALANSSKDMVITVGKGKVTLKNAAGKTISMKDNRGSYTMSKSAITLGSNFAGTMDSAKYLSTVTTINGKSSAKTVTIKGNAKANTIYGGSGANTVYGNAGNDKLYGYAGNDTLSGGDGNDTLYGGAGNDMLTGGAGKDTFVYANGEGSDTIKDYVAGQDTLQISSGSISKATLANSNKDLVFAVGAGKVTLTGAATKAISLKDSRGSYTASNTTITLGSNFTGTMDAAKYLASVKTIDGRNATKAVNITGNAQSNTIYAGKAGGTLKGGAGDDVYTVELPNESKISLIEIDNSGQLDSDADCLVIENLKGVNPDIHFDRKRTVLTINTSQGTIITVKNWDTNPLSYLLLSGISTLTTNQINGVYGAIKNVKISQNSTTYYGDLDTQKIDVTCTNSDIYTGISGDIVTIIGSTNSTHTVTGGKNNRIYGGPGSDLIKDSEYRNTIYGGDGDDEIHGSTTGSIYGDNGDDLIEVGNASGYFVNGGAGSDQITVFGRSGSFYGEDGNDTFTIYASSSDENYNIQIDGGSGNDTYICDIRSLEENGILTIDNQSASKTDMDFLKVLWTKAEEFTLSLNEESTELTIKQSSNNAGIVVKGWNTYPLSKIEFSDATYTAEQINTMVAASIVDSNGNNVEVNSTVSGSNGADTFVYNSTSGNMTVKDYTEGEDILQIADGEITKTEIVDGNVVLTVGDEGNTITLEGAAGKSIEIHNNNGSFTLSEEEISLGTDYTGDIDASAYPPTVTTIDGRNTEFSVNITGNAQDNIIYSGQAGGTLNGGAGNDTLTGDMGIDTFVFDGKGNDVITDYKKHEDVLKIVDGIINYTELTNGCMKFTVGEGSVTVNGGSDTQIIAIQDNNGSYSVSTERIELGSDYIGVMDAWAYLSTIKTIDGRKALNTVEICGNSQANTIYGGSGNDYLLGGLGSDTFVYSSGDDVIIDYTWESTPIVEIDTLKIEEGIITGTEVIGENVKFTVGTGSVTLEQAATKTIRLMDNRGSYTVSSTSISTGSDFSGTMDAGAYFSTITRLNGQSAVNTVNLIGNAQNNTIYAGKAGGTYQGGLGDDTLYCDAGEDVFVYSSGDGNDVINNYEAGKDIIIINDNTVTRTQLVGDNVKFRVGSVVGGGSITVESAANKEIAIQDSNGSYTVSDTTISLGHDYTGTVVRASTFLDSITTISGRLINGELDIYGNATDNVIYASMSGGKIFGQNGDDTIYGYSGNDNLYGGEGNDTLYGGDGDDHLGGGEGNDTLYGGDGNDQLSGNEGNNYLYGGGGDDALFGGEGNDTFVYESGNDRIFHYASGMDIIKFNSNVSLLTSEVSGIDVLLKLSNGNTIKVVSAADKEIAYLPFNESEPLFIAPQDDLIIGTDGDDDIDGTDNDDVIYGELGNDYLYGYEGNDKLYGGFGDDVLHPGSGGVKELYGEYGADRLYGGGDDLNEVLHLYGGKGNDTFVFDPSSAGSHIIYDYDLESEIIELEGVTITNNEIFENDTLLTLSSGGTVYVKDTNYENISFKTTAIFGTDDDDELYGNDDGILIKGYDGNDIIHGGAGDDSIYGEDGDDTIYGNDGRDDILSGSGSDTIHGGAGEDRLYGGDGDDTIYGDDDYDFIYSGFGSDTIYGGDGDDWILAYNGDLTETNHLYGGMGDDTFDFDCDSVGRSIIYDYEIGHDIIFFSDSINYKSSSVSGDNVTLNLSTGGKVEILGVAGQNITFNFGDGYWVDRIFPKG